MPNPEIAKIYNRYLEELKPLVSDLESRNERFVTNLIVDLPLMLDDLANAEFESDPVRKQELIARANNQLEALITSFQYCIISCITDKKNLFCSRNSLRVRRIIDRGRFIGKFDYKIKDIRKLGENPSAQYNEMIELEKLIDDAQKEALSLSRQVDDYFTTALKWLLTIILSLVFF